MPLQHLVFCSETMILAAVSTVILSQLPSKVILSYLMLKFFHVALKTLKHKNKKSVGNCLRLSLCLTFPH